MKTTAQADFWLEEKGERGKAMEINYSLKEKLIDWLVIGTAMLSGLVLCVVGWFYHLFTGKVLEIFPSQDVD